MGKIEEGLKRSRVILFCMSANALDSHSALLEADTFRFATTERGAPLHSPRVDGVPMERNLAQLLRIK